MCSVVLEKKLNISRDFKRNTFFTLVSRCAAQNHLIKYNTTSPWQQGNIKTFSSYTYTRFSSLKIFSKGFVWSYLLTLFFVQVVRTSWLPCSRPRSLRSWRSRLRLRRQPGGASRARQEGVRALVAGHHRQVAEGVEGDRVRSRQGSFRQLCHG